MIIFFFLIFFNYLKIEFKFIILCFLLLKSRISVEIKIRFLLKIIFYVEILKK